MAILFEKQLDVFFRGERNYIYGPDLYNNTVALVRQHFNTNELATVDFSSHKMTDCGLTFRLCDEQQNIENVQSKISFAINGKKYYGYLIENFNVVSKRLPYPEEEIIRDCVLDYDQKSATLNKLTAFKLTDNYTALTKHLHKNIHSEISGKWIFVRIQYDNYSFDETYSEISVVQTKNLSNKYTANTLFIDGSKVGCLYFSLI